MTTKNSQVAEYAQNKAWSGRGRLETLVAELDRQRESRLDITIDTRSLRFGVKSDGSAALFPANPQATEWLDSDGMTIIDKAIPQLCARVSPGVPSGFFKTLVSEREGRAVALMNGLLEDTGQRRFVRMLDGKVRAFLGNSYRVIDNYDVAFTALDSARANNAEVLEAALSETQMRLKFVNYDIWRTIDGVRANGSKSDWFAGGLGSQQHLSKVAARSQGDLPGGPGTVWPVVTVTNSETGHGSFNVRIGILQGICFNLATVESVARHIHLGERMEEGVYTDEAVSADSKAIMLKCRDAVAAAFKPETFDKIVAAANDAQKHVLKSPANAVEAVVKGSYMTDAAKDSILRYFLKDYSAGGETRYGLAQAVARYSQDVDDADGSSDLEDLAGKLVMSGEMVAAC